MLQRNLKKRASNFFVPRILLAHPRKSPFFLLHSHPPFPIFPLAHSPQAMEGKCASFFLSFLLCPPLFTTPPSNAVAAAGDSSPFLPPPPPAVTKGDRRPLRCHPPPPSDVASTNERAALRCDGGRGCHYGPTDRPPPSPFPCFEKGTRGKGGKRDRLSPKRRRVSFSLSFLRGTHNATPEEARSVGGWLFPQP